MSGFVWTWPKYDQEENRQQKQLKGENYLVSGFIVRAHSYKL